MDFNLNLAQRAAANNARDFTAEYIAPHSQTNDREGTFHSGLLQAIASQGYFAMRLPAKHGGQNFDTTSVGLVLEELARGDLSACFPVLNAALIGHLLAVHASAAQLKSWLPEIATGKAITALALTEAHHGTDAAAIEMEAVFTNGGWRLNGSKESIMVATYATHVLVFARTGGRGSSGISAFYVPMSREGILVTASHDLGCKAGGRGQIKFDDVEASAEEMVGEQGGGFRALLSGFGVSRAWIALMALSIAQTCVDEGFKHAGSREAFGQPLSKFQAVTFPLVEHSTYIRSARLLTLEALWEADQGLDPALVTNMAKWWAPKLAVEAALQCLLTLGKIGWSEEGPIAQRLRDVIGLQLADGTAAATKLVVSRKLLGRDLAP